MTPLYHTSIADIPRFWAPLGHEVQTDSRSFLRSPVFNPDRFELTPDSNLVPTTSLVNVPGLILLGTPGSGKSVELERLREASGASTPTFSIALGEIAGPEDLQRSLVDQGAFQAWRQDRADLVLFLDSLDEGRLSVDNLALLLRRHLDGPSQRLRLRITCRAADWPEGLGRHLDGWMGEGNLRSLTLTPLRAVDADADAEVAGAFLGRGHVRQTDAVLLEAGTVALRERARVENYVARHGVGQPHAK